MVTRLDIEDFLVQSTGHPIIDVRAPAEYQHGHIPGAIPLPLFSDEERAIIGTLYKQKGREAAMIKGLDFYGKNMQHILEGLKQLSDDRQLFVHCWRGGMRSGVVAWMLDLFGYKVATLNRGYKAFRRAVLESFSQQKNILILGGKTGSAKTPVLHALKASGEQVIDLERLAHHKGSAFGGIGEKSSPSQEQFENDLFTEFRNLDSRKPVWLEDESQRIGLMNLPNAVWEQMRNAKVIYLDIPFEERLNYLVETYGSLPMDELKAATHRIQKKLGGLDAKNTIQFFDEGNIRDAFAILLKYYDKLYSRGTASRSPGKIEFVSFDKIEPSAIAQIIVSQAVTSSH